VCEVCLLLQLMFISFSRRVNDAERNELWEDMMPAFISTSILLIFTLVPKLWGCLLAIVVMILQFPGLAIIMKTIMLEDGSEKIYYFIAGQ